ncbi:g8804 [Coccomyxa viridis]|uniref:Glycosyltransferase n=1 Tax=Coccomyxa viridis TaxID=1274662 RepID=A0ABP1G5F4_9CHLO
MKNRAQSLRPSWTAPIRAIVFTALLMFNPASCGKVLVVPLPSAESHTFVMVKVVQELAARGHQVLMVIPESDLSTLDKVDASSFNVTTYKAAFTKQEVKELVRGTRQAVGSNFLGSLESFLVYLESLMGYCRLFLADKTAETVMKEFDPDVLVGDVAYACALGQSEILRRGEGRGRLPRVMVSALPILDPLVPGRMENMPNNLAYVPQMGTSLSNRMTFLERLKNAVFYYGTKVGEQWRALPMYLSLGKEHNVDCLSTEVSHGSTMFLYNMDFAMEWPRPLPPNVQLVGALLPTQAKPLPPIFEALLEGVGPEGAVYASMGTLCNFGPEEFVAIGQALSGLPNLVIWKLAPGDLPGNATVESLSLSSNVKVVEWTPQNDLLGDGRVKAFVTHGGLNSIYEAAFHGVPIVGIPVFGDQPDNVMKAVYRDFGLMISPGRITAEGLRGMVNRVLAEPSFGEAAQKVSVRMRAHRLKPAEKAADWIEHVMATDGDQYLKTPEHLLPWHVRNMLDVYLALAAIFGGLIWLMLLGLRRLLFGRRQQAAPATKAAAPGKTEGPKTFHVVASSLQGNAPPARERNWGVLGLAAAAGAASALVAAAFCS